MKNKYIFKSSLLSKMMSLLFAMYMFISPAMPLAYLNPVSAATGYASSESGFSYSSRYIRAGNLSDIVTQIYTPSSAVDVRFQVDGVDVSFSESVQDADPVTNSSNLDNDIYTSSIGWRLNKNLGNGQYTITAEFYDGADWNAVTGSTTVYSLDTPYYSYTIPSTSGLIFRPTDKFARVRIDDQYNQMKEFRFKIYNSSNVQQGGEYILQRADCDTRAAGNYLICDLMRDYTGTLPTLSEGDYYVRTQSYTYANNGIRYNNAISNTFSIDGTKPVVSDLNIDVPAAAYKDSITGSALATDNIVVSSVDFWVTAPRISDGACDGSGSALASETVYSTDLDGRYRSTLDISSLDGTYCLNAMAEDLANAHSSIARLSFVADNTPPSVPTLLSPIDNYYSTNVSIAQTWSGSADTALYQYQSCNVDPGDASAACSDVIYEMTTTGTSRNVGAGLSDMRFWWRVRAVDAYGNWSDWSESRKITIDSNAPTSTLSLISVPVYSYTPPFFKTATVFEGTATDTFSGVAGVACYVSSDNGSSWTFAVDATPNDGSFSSNSEDFQCNISGLASDTYLVEARATDVSGLTELAPYSNNIEFAVDDIMPEVKFTSSNPSKNSYLNGTVTVEGTFDGTHPDDSDLRKVKVGLKRTSDGKTRWCLDLLDQSAGTYSCATDTTTDLFSDGSSFTDGKYKLILRGVDKANNKKTTTRVVYLDNTPPYFTAFPSDMTKEATSASGAVAAFTVTAEDAVDGSVTPVCDYNSGDTFPMGTTTVTCSATDALGNTTEDSFDITVEDTTAPEVDITNPMDGDILSGTVSIKGSVADIFPHHYYLMAKDSNGTKLTSMFPGTVNDSVSFTNKELYSWNTTLVPNGEYTIWLAARDQYDNRDDSVSYDSIVVYVDNTTPEIEHIEDRDLNEGDVFPAVTLTVTDNKELAKTCLRVFDPSGAQVYPTVTTGVQIFIDDGCDSVSGTSYTYDVNDWFGLPSTFWTTPTTIESPVLEEGAWTFEYWVVDEAGNSSDVQTTVYTLNNLAPTFASVTTTTLSTRAVKMTATPTNGNAPYSYVWTDGNFGACSGTSNTVTTPTTAGDYRCKVIVTDLDGESIERTVYATVQPAVTYYSYVPVVTTQEETPEEETTEETEDPTEPEVLGARTCDKTRTISGKVFIDANGDGKYTEGEEYISGVKVTLSYTVDGEVYEVAKLTSDENGVWTSDVCPGEYTVTVDISSLPDQTSLDEAEITVNVSESEENTDFAILLTQEEAEKETNYMWLFILLGVFLVAIVAYLLYRWRNLNK